MSQLIELMKGRKTYALGIGLIMYMIVWSVNGQEINQELVLGWLAMMGITVRAGVGSGK